jgi:tetratricopeptide (TPR) repeat protein
MFRIGSVTLCGIFLIACAVTNGNPPDDAKFNNALSVQAAMVRARALLNEMQSAKSVEVLEEQLAKVNGNPQYLSLLRDAYRAHIRDLHLAGQPAQAQRYLDRLCILDPNAAKDSTLWPQADSPPRHFEPAPVKEAKQLLPNWMPRLTNPFAKKEETKPAPEQKATIRLLGDNTSVEDPFDRKNQREMPIDAGKGESARDLLARGANEFKLARYSEAKVCFEQAYKNDQGCLEVCKEQWAYCIIKGVTESMELPGVLPGKLPELQKQVEGAIQMAPTKMMAVGQELLTTLSQRAKAVSASPQVQGSTLKVKHLGPNKEGWQVAQSQYFLIFHKQNEEYAQRVAQIAETTRATMYRKWFDSDGVEWQPQCELILHPNATGYTHMTGVPSNSPGHSRIESDPSGRVISRRMDLRHDINGMMDAVLPHETTHVVLAGMFGASHVPRWADEGIAVLSEPNEKIDMHRRNLLKNYKDGHLFGLKELMELKDYPHPRRIGAFYAQSVVLTEFLAQMRGPKTLTEFIKDGLRHGYDTSLERHYNMNFTQLEEAWQKQVINDTDRFAAMK